MKDDRATFISGKKNYRRYVRYKRNTLDHVHTYITCAPLFETLGNELLFNPAFLMRVHFGEVFDVIITQYRSVSSFRSFFRRSNLARKSTRVNCLKRSRIAPLSRKTASIVPFFHSRSVRKIARLNTRDPRTLASDLQYFKRTIYGARIYSNFDIR